MLNEPEPQGHVPEHEVVVTPHGKVACTKCGRCLNPRIVSRMGTVPCGDPQNASTRAWVRRLHGQVGIPWAQLQGAGNLARNVVSTILSAIDRLRQVPAPRAPRRRIWGKRPMPPEWMA